MVSNYGQFSLPASSWEVLKTKTAEFMLLHSAYSTPAGGNVHADTQLHPITRVRRAPRQEEPLDSTWIKNAGKYYSTTA